MDNTILEDAEKCNVERTYFDGELLSLTFAVSNLEAYTKLREERVKPKRLDEQEITAIWRALKNYSDAHRYIAFANAIMDKLGVTE